MRAKIAAAVLLVVCLVVLAACGGDDDKDASGGSTPKTASPSEIEKFCKEVRGFNEAVANVDANSPAKEAQRTADRLQSLADKAPAEIEAAMKTVADSAEFFAKNPGEVLGPERQPKTDAAGAQVIEWTKAKCGEQLGKPT